MLKITIKNSNNVYVEFPYNPQIVEKVKAIPGRTWNPKDKNWWIPRCYLDRFISSLGGYNYVIDDIENKKDFEKAKQFKFKTAPFKHQIEGFEFGKQMDLYLLGDEQGLGKTKQAIDTAVYKKLLYGYKHSLIVCGVKTLIYNRKQEIQNHSDEECIILGQKEKKTKNGIKLVSGDNKSKLEDLKNIDNLPYFIITNVETIRKRADNKVFSMLKTYIDSGKIGMVIVDEFHKCKNPISQQGSALLELKPQTRIALTGTPIMNNPLDLYSLLNWLDIEKHNYYAFKYHYCYLDGFKQVVGFRNLEELSEKLNSVMLRRKKEDVLDLPPKIYTTEYLEMDTPQLKIYEEVRKALATQVDKILLSPNPFAQLIRLRQATAFTGILSSTVRVSCKYDRALDIVEEVTSGGGKVVIFSQWTQVLDPLIKVLQDEGYNPAIITGKITEDKKEYYKQEFETNDNCKVLLGTIDSMGTGLTLTQANTCIFLDSPWNKSTKEQAEDRLHRIGTKGTVNIITLVCKDTIDERVEEIVYNKGMLSDAIVDGNINPSKRKALFEYLLS